MVERRVRLAALPEMRIAYLEKTLPATPEGPPIDSTALPGMWDEFNEWRLRTRPALGRVDIAAIGWAPNWEPGSSTLTYRTGVPVRSDYQAEPPAKTTFFPGGDFLYCYADDVDEIGPALTAAFEELKSLGRELASGTVEVFKFHYNLDQHPADCGVLLKPRGGETRPGGGPLRIASV